MHHIRDERMHIRSRQHQAQYTQMLSRLHSSHDAAAARRQTVASLLASYSTCFSRLELLADPLGEFWSLRMCGMIQAIVGSRYMYSGLFMRFSKRKLWNSATSLLALSCLLPHRHRRCVCEGSQVRTHNCAGVSSWSRPAGRA